MPISRKTPLRQIQAYIDEVLKRKEQVIIRNLCYLGEMCVNKARESEAYKDQTSNLRSSTGYILLKNGVIIHKWGFEAVKESGKEGAATGESFAKSLIASNTNGFVLIVVAGMNYASHLEATGRDVLTSAEQLAIKEMPKMLKQLKIAA